MYITNMVAINRSGIIGLKGELYIPHDIRKKLELNPNSRIKLVVEDGKLLVEKIVVVDLKSDEYKK